MSTRRHHSAEKPRKRSKTFTGCWTCRARKVKCDEVRPCCRQCGQKGLECEGYDVRLQWVAPEMGDSTTTDINSLESVQPKCHRSRVTLGGFLLQI